MHSGRGCPSSCSKVPATLVQRLLTEAGVARRRGCWPAPDGWLEAYRGMLRWVRKPSSRLKAGTGRSTCLGRALRIRSAIGGPGA